MVPILLVLLLVLILFGAGFAVEVLWCDRTGCSRAVAPRIPGARHVRRRRKGTLVQVVNSARAAGESTP